MLVSINASENGGTEVDLPRKLLDSKTTSDTEKPFLTYEVDIERKFFSIRRQRKKHELLSLQRRRIHFKRSKLEIYTET